MSKSGDKNITKHFYFCNFWTRQTRISKPYFHIFSCILYNYIHFFYIFNSNNKTEANNRNSVLEQYLLQNIRQKQIAIILC